MNLKAAAITAGIKPRTLAKRMGVSEPTISNWLNRKTPVPHRHMTAFAMLIHVHIEDLLPPQKTET